jgi:hypothetical protein
MGAYNQQTAARTTLFDLLISINENQAATMENLTVHANFRTEEGHIMRLHHVKEERSNIRRKLHHIFAKKFVKILYLWWKMEVF